MATPRIMSLQITETNKFLNLPDKGSCKLTLLQDDEW
jgi:hypothetical protein